MWSPTAISRKTRYYGPKKRWESITVLMWKFHPLWISWQQIENFGAQYQRPSIYLQCL